VIVHKLLSRAFSAALNKNRGLTPWSSITVLRPTTVRPDSQSLHRFIASVGEWRRALASGDILDFRLDLNGALARVRINNHIIIHDHHHHIHHHIHNLIHTPEPLGRLLSFLTPKFLYCGTGRSFLALFLFGREFPSLATNTSCSPRRPSQVLFPLLNLASSASQ
jgi:hypothetical protein